MRKYKKTKGSACENGANRGPNIGTFGLVHLKKSVIFVKNRDF